MPCEVVKVARPLDAGVLEEMTDSALVAEGRVTGSDAPRSSRGVVGPSTASLGPRGDLVGAGERDEGTLALVCFTNGGGFEPLRCRLGLVASPEVTERTPLVSIASPFTGEERARDRRGRDLDSSWTLPVLVRLAISTSSCSVLSVRSRLRSPAV